MDFAPKSSKSKIDNFLYLLHHAGDIDDEVLLLLVGNHSRNLHVGLPYFNYERLNIFEVDEDVKLSVTLTRMAFLD